MTRPMLGTIRPLGETMIRPTIPQMLLPLKETMNGPHSLLMTMSHLSNLGIMTPTLHLARMIQRNFLKQSDKLEMNFL